MEDDNDDTPIYISIDGKIEELKLPRKLVRWCNRQKMIKVPLDFNFKLHSSRFKFKFLQSEAEKEIILQGTKQSREIKTFHLDTKAIEGKLI